MADNPSGTAPTPGAVAAPASSAPAPRSDAADNFRALIEKGEGVLTKRNGVWTYPSCANDPSGTNLVLPKEYVTDAVIQAAIVDGTLRAAVVAPTGFVSSVRLADDDTPILHTGLAGSAEAGTELPPNSRPEHDAGAKPVNAEDVERQSIAAADAMRGITPQPAKAKR